uniref:Uncharacterized protein n=1 Tax=Physcomitrium patens TaxID=3218 RepID=A0A7I3ZDS8_PHYPA
MVGLMNHWLPEHHRHPPLSAPVSRHSHKINFYLGIVLVVFMAVSVVALFCICYHLEWRLRLQARNVARRVSRGNGFSVQDAGCSQDMIGARVGNRIKQVHYFFFLNEECGNAASCCIQPSNIVTFEDAFLFKYSYNKSILVEFFLLHTLGISPCNVRAITPIIPDTSAHIENLGSISYPKMLKRRGCSGDCRRQVFP